MYHSPPIFKEPHPPPPKPLASSNLSGQPLGAGEGVGGAGSKGGVGNDTFLEKVSLKTMKFSRYLCKQKTQHLLDTDL